jgi:hypothetical protein
MERRFLAGNEAMALAFSAAIELIYSVGMVHVFRETIPLENAIGSHACSLEALACVWSMAFLSSVH